MLRHRIALDENADPNEVVRQLDAWLNKAKLEESKAAAASSEANVVVRQFIESGRRLAENGSQFNAERVVHGDGYAITIKFAAKKSKSFLKRVLGF